MTEINPPDRDVLAAKHFPKAWAAIATKPGKSDARQKLRRQAEHAEQLAVMRKEGHSCATCLSFEAGGIPGVPNSTDSWCARHSDFHGYAITRATDLCVHWRDV